MAALVAHPSAADFGLRPVALRPAVKWTLAGAAAFYGFSIVYALVAPEGTQDTLEVLGVQRSERRLTSWRSSW